MLKSIDLKSSEKFPSWITNHSVFTKCASIKKVFPEIGLSNFEEPTTLDNSPEIKMAADTLVNCLSQSILERASTLTRYSETKSFGDKRKVKYKQCSHLLKQMKTALSQKKYVVTDTNGKIKLCLHKDINAQDKKIAFRDGESIFKVYTKLNETLRNGHFCAMPSLEEMPEFKSFSSVNIPLTNYKLIFSSDNLEGAWDIATMSMRGINSCQTWGQGNATHIVGSIVDPFTGIIYLTSGVKFNEYGSKMIRRCVVRFAVSEKLKSPCIFLEKMYPDFNQSAYNIFEEAIKKKLNINIPIIYTSNIHNDGPIYIPLSPVVAGLEAKDQPYRDSGMIFKTDKPDLTTSEEKYSNTLTLMNKGAADLIKLAVKCVKITSLSEQNDKMAVKNLRGYVAKGKAYPATWGPVILSICNQSKDMLIGSEIDIKNPWEMAAAKAEFLLSEKYFDLIKTSLKNYFVEANCKTSSIDNVIIQIVDKSKDLIKSYVDKQMLLFKVEAIKFKKLDNRIDNVNYSKLLEKVNEK